MTEIYTSKLTPESKRRFDQAEYLMRWLEPRLKGSAGDMETTFDMIMAYYNSAFADGIDEGATLIEKLNAAVPSKQLTIAAGALRELAALDRVEVDYMEPGQAS